MPAETVPQKISRAAHEVQRPVFYSIAIIIVAYLPIFTLQAVEGRLFKPMAWTVAFALLGALLFSMFVGPVLASLVFPKGTKEWHNPLMGLLTEAYGWALGYRDPLALGHAGGGAWLTLAGAYLLARTIGSEFLPHLDEGAIWVRGTLAPSTGPTEGIRLANQVRVILASFPEVTTTTSQVGRPDDGTDTTGFFNTEYFVDLKPKEQWRPVFHQDKEELIAAMNRELDKIPGVIWNFSQPISDNMEEAVSGVKGELAIKVYGDDLKTLEEKGDQIVSVMRTVNGSCRISGLFRVLGQPNLNLTVDRDSRRALSDQRRGRAGRHSDRRRRQRSDPGSAGRTALRPGDALSAGLPRHQGSDREYPAAFALRRARFPGPTLQHRGGGRRVRSLPRRKSALHRHQVRRARTRPGRRGRRGDQEGGPTSQAAGRIPHRLGRRIRQPAARPEAARC